MLSQITFFLVLLVFLSLSPLAGGVCSVLEVSHHSSLFWEAVYLLFPEYIRFSAVSLSLSRQGFVHSLRELTHCATRRAPLSFHDAVIRGVSSDDRVFVIHKETDRARE
jgi:hypothetical protein